MITEIDQEIVRLNPAREALATASTGAATKGKPGRPAKATTPTAFLSKAPTTKKHKRMSAAARKKIAAAQKARWAAFHAAKDATNK